MKPKVIGSREAGGNRKREREKWREPEKKRKRRIILRCLEECGVSDRKN